MNSKARYLLFVFLQFLIVLNAKQWPIGPMQDGGEMGMGPWGGPMGGGPMGGGPMDGGPMGGGPMEEESTEASTGPDKSANRDPYYNAVCTAKDRCVTTCPADYQDGCICYNDGLCLEQSVNRCHQCSDPDVFAVFEGQSCPRRHPNICHHYRHHCGHHRGHHRGFHRHHRREFESERESFGQFADCNYQVNSCVCKKTGECSMKLLNLCDECRAEKHYQAIFINATCPDTSLNATCNATNGANPAPTTCNYPYAYLCQAQDRNSTTCDLESSAQACV
jgi:hypothetical protein